MSLATRCTACDTVFRVQQEQLQVSQGWVRCGICQQEFNALDGLFDLPNEAPAAPASAPSAVESADPARPDSGDESDLGATAQPRYEPSFESPSTALDDSSAQGQDARGNAELLGSGDNVSEPDVSPQGRQFTDDDESVAPLPEFIRQAKDDTLSDKRGTRIVLGLLALLLAMTLILQYAFHFRNTLAASLPQTAATLSTLCRLTRCKIEPPLRIDDVVVESSALTSESAGNLFRLVVVLRNRGAFAVAMPSVELTLTDSGGQVLARRTLRRADFYDSPGALMPAKETSVLLLLAGANIRSAGYTVEAFYP